MAMWDSERTELLPQPLHCSALMESRLMFRETYMLVKRDTSLEKQLPQAVFGESILLA
jgi:hypothetical protein